MPWWEPRLCRPKHEADQPQTEQPDSLVIDWCPSGLHALAEEGLYQEYDDQADGDVDGEDPVPAEVLDDESAQEWGDDGGDAPGGSVQSDHPGPLAQGVYVSQDRISQRLDGAGAKALKEPGADELGHGLGECAEAGPDHKNQESDGQEGFTAVPVGEFPIDGGGDGTHEKIYGVDPVHDR